MTSKNGSVFKVINFNSIMLLACRNLSLLLHISLCTFGYLYATSNTALSQVTTDGTVNTQVNQNGNVAEITEGQTRGSNLFHSFQDFSVSTGNEAFFNNANDISNIFSRVTGGNISSIDGAIRANGSASLFLINPAGIIFGENASLSIGGSFYGSSASSVLFEDGEFGAVDNIEQPVLTVNAPIGLGFRENPGDIVNRSSVQNSVGDFVGLEVLPGKNLTLVGGNINFEAGQATASGGNIELGSLSTAGIVDINDDGSLSFPEDVSRADITLSNKDFNIADVDVTGVGGGNITIDAQNLSLRRSFIRAGITNDSTSEEAQAGNIAINVAENISLLDRSRISNEVSFEAIGNSGNITIDTGSLELINGGTISTSTVPFGQGNGGSISIDAAETISLDGGNQSAFGGGIFSNISQNAIGDAGKITIDARSLSLTRGGRISAATFGDGDAGEINLNIGENISVDGATSSGEFISGIFSSVGQNAIGKAGNISVSTDKLSITNSGAIVSSYFGEQGNAGKITINSNNISINGSGQDTGIFSTNVGTENTVGEAGGIDITTTNLSVVNDGILNTSTAGQGDAGDINITASNEVFFEGSRIISTTDGQGNGGTIRVNTNSLSLIATSATPRLGSLIRVDTSGAGDAGNIHIRAADIFIDFSVINSLVQFNPEPIGNSGDIEIFTDSLTMQSGAIQAVTTGAGNAGSIKIDAKETILLDGGSSTISSSVNLIGLPSFIERAELTGNAGDIEINANSLILDNNFLGIQSANQGSGNGGNIKINTNFLSIDGSTINAAATENGNAGNIEITSDGIQLNSGEITGETSFGTGGNIALNIDENLTLRNNSAITAQAFNAANGGNLQIDADFIIAFPNQIEGNGNDIIASAQQGQGGNITINAEALFGITEREAVEENNTNDIDASSEFSLDGTVTINTPDINPVQGETDLAQNIVVPERTPAQACQANRELAAKSGLIIEGKGGIVPDPGWPLNSLNVYVNGESTSAKAIPAPIETAKGKIQPARGVKVTESGEVILTAYRTDNSGDRIPEGSANCSQILND